MSTIRERARTVALEAFGMPGLSDNTKLHGLTFGAIVEVAKAAATREREELLEAAKAAVEQWRSPDEGHAAYFERQAERFYRDTGLMAPGKSQPLEMSSVDNEAERRTAWDEWINRVYVRLVAAIAKAEGQ